METPEVAVDLIGRDPELQKTADDLREIAKRFAEVGSMVVVRRCQSIANANPLRGQELLRFAIQAVNERALITAYTMARALDETMAAVVHARLRIERSIEAGNAEDSTGLVDRLTCGNRYLAERRDSHPKSFNVIATAGGRR